MNEGIEIIIVSGIITIAMIAILFYVGLTL
jgi:hypothetical protein